MRQTYLTDEVLRKIKQIEIHTKRLLRGSLIGDSRSAVKGSGLDFDQIRDYQMGDDVRFIDWKSSARMNTVLVKQYIEERSRVVLLAVDISGSQYFGSGETLKQDILAQIASILALITDIGKDKVGLILFADSVELYVPPSRGRLHVHRIMEAVFGCKPKKRTTNITSALKKLAELKRKDSLVFVISDFIDENIDPSYLSLVSRMYDLVAIRCTDLREHEFPSIGFIAMEDAESDESILLDLRKKPAHMVKDLMQERLLQQDRLFRRYGVEVLDVMNDNTYIGDLIRFFRRRMQY